MARRRRRTELPSVLATPDPEALSRIRDFYGAFLRAAEGTRRDYEAVDTLNDGLRVYMENAFWIVNKQKQRQLFKWNKAQELFYEEVYRPQYEAGLPVRGIVVKPRKKGFSAFISGVIQANVICQRHARAGIVAQDKDTAKTLFERFYRYYYDNLLPDMRPELDIGTRQAMVLVYDGIDSQIEVQVARDIKGSEMGSTGRGKDYHYLHLTEIPYWNNPSATTSALCNSVPDEPDTMIIYESTARACGDYFHNEWTRACEGVSNYKPFFVPWFLDDEYTLPFEDDTEKERFANDLRDDDDPRYGNEVALFDKQFNPLIERFPLTLEHVKWRRRKIDNDLKSVEVFEREYPGTAEEAFARAGGNWLNPKIMRVYVEKTRPPVAVGDFVEPEYGNVPTLKPAHNGFVRIFREAHPHAEYIIGCDPCEGGNSDNAAIVFERGTEAVVAEIHGSPSRPLLPAQFGYQVGWAGLVYNTAWICPEGQYSGRVVGILLEELGYPKLVRSSMLRIGELPFSQHPDKIGWWSTARLRQYLQDTLKEWFEGMFYEGAPEDLKDIPIRELVVEAMAMVLDDNGKATAPHKNRKQHVEESGIGYRDDRVLALFGAKFTDLALSPSKLPELRERDALYRREVEYRDSIVNDRKRSSGSFSGLVPKGWVASLPRMGASRR